MQTLLIGGMLSVGILVLTFFNSKAGIGTFFNPEGLAIVLGGTFSILLMTSKKDELILMMKQIRRLIFKKAAPKKLKDILLETSQSIQRGQIPTDTGHPFLNKALGWLSAGLRGPALVKLLTDGAQLEIERVNASAQILSNLSKYPPALGMVGTVFGIIAIFNGLGSAEGQKSIGVNLAFAMTATLYGLISSNFFVSPISELLLQSAQQEEVELSMIVETVKLWSEKESHFFIQENIELYHVA